MNAALFTTDMLDPRLPKTAQVYDHLRRAITSLRYRPGDLIIEKELCEQFGISRTPVREALLQLSTQKLVIIKPNSSTMVSPIKIDDVLEGQLVRQALECRSVRLAARFIDDVHADALETNLLRQKRAIERSNIDELYQQDEDFHKLICSCSGYPTLWRMLNDSNGQLNRVRRLAFPDQADFAEVYNEHHALYQAIAARDEEQAERLMREHIDSLFQSLLELILNKSPWFAEPAPGTPAIGTLADLYSRVL